MASEIERIVDRKTIRGRVHYLVVWRGFGEENNTWESRMDLVADGFSDIIREYEGRNAGNASSARGRSPSRRRSTSRGKSPSTERRPKGRPRGRSNSTARSPSASRSRRRSSSTARTDEETDLSESSSVATPSRRRSSRGKSSMQSIDTNEEDASYSARRESQTPLESFSSPTKEPLNNDGLMGQVSPTPYVEADIVAGISELWKYLSEDGWLIWFFSVLTAVGSLITARFLSATDVLEPSWRKWLPFLIVVVALLLVFHQRDSRTSIKWIGIALSFRCAMELIVVVGTSEVYLYGCCGAAHVALLVAAFTIFWNREHTRAQVSTITYFVGWLALLLSDSWLYNNNTHPVNHTRGELMVAASVR